MSKVHAQAPDSLSFQGVLTDTNGVPVADGTYNLLTKMYKGSTRVWEQTIGGGFDNSVSVARGTVGGGTTPGHAVSHKIGELKLLDVRKRAKAELGERFDIRRLHAVVLENGSSSFSTVGSDGFVVPIRLALHSLL